MGKYFTVKRGGIPAAASGEAVRRRPLPGQCRRTSSTLGVVHAVAQVLQRRRAERFKRLRLG